MSNQLDIKQAEYETEHSIGNYIKVVLIGLKVLYFIASLSFGIKTYRKLYGTYRSKETLMMSIFIAEMVLLMVFDLLYKYITLLYLMLLVSNYSVYFMFSMLTHNDYFQKNDKIEERFKPIQLLSHTMYAICLIMILVPGFQPMCTSQFVYPAIFIMLFSASALLTGYIIFFYVQGFYNEPHIQIAEGPDHDVKAKCFLSQTKVFTILAVVSSISQLILGFIGVFMVEETGFLGCGKGGQEWLYITAFGNTFSTLHIIVLIVHCAMCNATFYKIPQKYGYFNLNHDTNTNGDYKLIA